MCVVCVCVYVWCGVCMCVVCVCVYGVCGVCVCVCGVCVCVCVCVCPLSLYDLGTLLIKVWVCMFMLTIIDHWNVVKLVGGALVFLGKT